MYMLPRAAGTFDLKPSVLFKALAEETFMK